METIQRTNNDIGRFAEVAAVLLSQCVGDSQFKYALTRVLQSAWKAIDRYDLELAGLNSRFASIDDRGNIIVGEKSGFVFSPENMKKRQEEHRKLLDKVVPVGSYIIDLKRKLPIVLNGLQEEVLEGFILPQLKEPAAPEEGESPKENLN